MTSEKKPNIVLITFDCTRADRMGIAGYKKNITPFLDSLAKKGAYFKRAYSTGPGSPHSFVAILTSTLPFDYGGFGYIDRPRMLVSETLKSAGYTTIGVHSAAYMSAYFGYDRGWDQLVYLSNFKDGDVIPGIRRDTWQARLLKKLNAAHKFVKRKSPWIDKWVFFVIERAAFICRKIFVDIFRFRPAFIIAEEINQKVKEILPRAPRAPREPLFLWVHYMDPHAPYTLFRKIKGTFIQKIRYFLCDILPYFVGQGSWATRLFKSFFINTYDISIQYTDQNIKNLFEYLNSIEVINDDSLVILCSDHGEEFFEHGNVGHLATLYNVNLNVPLIFYGSKHLSFNGIIDRPVSLMDISPTILDVAGVEKPKVFKGQNIFNTEPRPIIGQVPDTEDDLSNQTFRGVSLIYDGYKFIKMIDQKMLFSLDDANEQNNLYDKKPELARRMEELIKPYEFIHPAN